MTEEILHESFYFFLNKIKDKEINWAVFGSFRLFLEGFSILPSDIDIITDEKGILLIENLFKDYIIKKSSYSQENNLRSFFGQIKIQNVIFDIVGNPENKVKGQWYQFPSITHKTYIKYDSFGKIPVLELEHEYLTSLLIKDLNKLKFLNSLQGEIRMNM